MTTKLKMLFLFISLLSIFSCGKSEREIEIEKQKVIEQKEEQEKIIVQSKEKEIGELNKKKIDELNKKYNAIGGIDTLKNYTYFLQELFLENNNLLSIEGSINDIIKLDSAYIIRVTKRDNIIADISVNRAKFLEINTLLKSNNHRARGCFILKPLKIIVANPEIKLNDDEVDVDFEGQSVTGDEGSYLYYDLDERLLIFKAELVDYYLKEKYVAPKE